MAKHAAVGQDPLPAHRRLQRVKHVGCKIEFGFGVYFNWYLARAPKATLGVKRRSPKVII
jgi:hypothetical protein